MTQFFLLPGHVSAVVTAVPLVRSSAEALGRITAGGLAALFSDCCHFTEVQVVKCDRTPSGENLSPCLIPDTLRRFQVGPPSSACWRRPLTTVPEEPEGDPRPFRLPGTFYPGHDAQAQLHVRLSGSGPCLVRQPLSTSWRLTTACGPASYQPGSF